MYVKRPKTSNVSSRRQTPIQLGPSGMDDFKMKQLQQMQALQTVNVINNFRLEKNQGMKKEELLNLLQNGH